MTPPKPQPAKSASALPSNRASRWIRLPSSTYHLNWRTEVRKGEIAMGTGKRLFLSVIALGALSSAASAQMQATDQTQPQTATSPAAAPVTTADQAVDRIIAREHQEIATLRHFTPIIETYIQEMKPDKELGAVPAVDHYFLGQANLSQGIVDTSMLTKKKGRMDSLNPLAHIGDYFRSEFVPAGFLQMIYLDE